MAQTTSKTKTPNETASASTAAAGERDALAEEIGRLVEAAKAGEWAARADLDLFEGVEREVVQGVNEMLDAVIGPLNVAAEYVDRISKGDIPELITDEYQGDFNEIKNNLNACIEAVGLLVADANMLAQAGVEGKLDTRADASKHQGDYAGIVEGVNNMLDAVIGPLNVAAEYIERIGKGDIPENITDDYAGDFNEIKNNLNLAIDAVNALVADANMLAQAGAEGKLDTRADAAKHQGDYAAVVEGVNNLLDVIIGPINEGAMVLEAAAQRDVTKRVEGAYQGDLAELKDNINAAIGGMDDALGQVAAAVVQVAEASGQIGTGSQSLAEGAAEQASALEEVSSLEQMSSMTKQNAGNADEATTLAGSAQSSADKGSEAMERMSQAIDDIQKSSQETSKIIKTIDEIAFQTNLLALNAAVEAARASDAGKGFAVVAEEVRNLAQRSAEAAKNTSDMIEELVKNSEGGVTISKEVAEALTEIADGAGKVNSLVAEIAAASNEQAEGIEQVNTAVGQMDQVTQQNAANSEESASASEELSAQAQELRAMVETFKLSTAAAAATQARATVHAPAAQKAAGTSLKLVGGEKAPKKAPAQQAPEDVIPLDDEDKEALGTF